MCSRMTPKTKSSWPTPKYSYRSYLFLSLYWFIINKQTDSRTNKPTPEQLVREVPWDDKESHHVIGGDLLVTVVDLKMDQDCPPKFQSDFQSLLHPCSHLDGRDTWLNDTILTPMVRYFQTGMSDTGLTPGFFRWILQPFLAMTVCVMQLGHSETCDFSYNVIMNTDHQYISSPCCKVTHCGCGHVSGKWTCVWKQTGHPVGVDMCLETDFIDIHDWFSLSDTHYQPTTEQHLWLWGFHLLHVICRLSPRLQPPRMETLVRSSTWYGSIRLIQNRKTGEPTTPFQVTVQVV